MKLVQALAGEKDSVKTGILVAAGLSVLAAGTLLLQWKRYATYRDGLAAARRSLDAVADAANQIKALKDEIKADEGFGKDDMGYISQQASASIGDVYPKEGKGQPPKGYRDRTYEVAPADKDKAYNRQNLALFFFRIESQTSRFRVTNLRVYLADKKRPEDDLWRFSAEFTSRTREAP